LASDALLDVSGVIPDVDHYQANALDRGVGITSCT
jgi:hypothetical protein